MIDKKIIAYLGRTPDFRKEVKLQDDGDGVVYIKEWNITSEKAKPTDAQLNALSSQAETLENNAIAVANRQKETRERDLTVDEAENVKTVVKD